MESPHMFYRIILLSLLITLSSCATDRLIQTDQEIDIVKQEAINTNKTAENLLLDYENKLTSLGEETLNFYAPLTMQQAIQNYDDAKNMFASSNANNSHDAKFLSINALRFIDKAVMNKQAVKLHLKNADTHFIELQKLQTPKLLPTEFTKIQERFTKLIKLIELGKTQDAITQESDLISDMIAVEINTLHKNHLGKAVEYINLAKEKNADAYAPLSLKEAEQLLESTQLFIEKSYRDRNAILERSDQTLQAAKKLFLVSEEAFFFHKSSNEKIEERIIGAYKFLDDVKNSLDIQNIELTSYKEQSARLLAELSAKAETAKQNLEALKTAQEITIQETKVIEPIIAPTKAIMSQETNKAVLPELFLTNSNPKQDHIEESLEFEEIEVIQ